MTGAGGTKKEGKQCGQEHRERNTEIRKTDQKDRGGESKVCRGGEKKESDSQEQKRV